MAGDAIALFVERSKAVNPRFELDTTNMQAVVEICYQLDGLPLALELAAARTKILGPSALLAHLQQPLRVLTGNTLNVPDRHQTLRNTIDWSYQLLSRHEQLLFSRLAIFVGGCTLESIEGICNAARDLPFDPLEGVTRIVDSSLLIPDVDRAMPRFLMLETIRAFGLEQLRLRDDLDRISLLHAAYFASVTEAADAEVRGPNQQIWLQRLELDLDNIRQALKWTYESGELELHLRLCAALWGFWVVRGHLSEARRWLENALARVGDALPLLQAKARLGAGNVVFRQGDYARATHLWTESLALFRAHHDLSSAVSVLHTIAWQANIQGAYTRAAGVAAEGVALAEQIADQRGVANSLQQLAVARQNLGEYALAAQHLERGLALMREVDDKRGIAVVLNSMGELARLQHDYVRAAGYYGESLSLLQELGDAPGAAMVLHNLGWVDYGQGKPDVSLVRFADSLEQAWEFGDKLLLAMCISGLAVLGGHIGMLERAARLSGAADLLLAALGAQLDRADQEIYALEVETLRAALGAAAFAAAWEDGQALPLEQVVTDALALRPQREREPK